ncbi:MAG: hypothetical protein V2J62_03955, partial [candidate division KSB1 bacterium]|nr:hypothetical protein [candidate division KSB1 bacterium]
STVLLGIITIVTAIIYARSELGIFNLMTIFVSLFYVPVALPMACGLIFKSLPRWSALNAIVNGLLVSFIARFILGYTIGVQIYAALFTTLLVLLASEPLRKLYLSKRMVANIVLLIWTTAQFGLFYLTSANTVAGINILVFAVSAVAFYISLVIFTRLFSRETTGDRMIVEKFFDKLAMPIDVFTELRSGDKSGIAAYGVVGIITLLVASAMLILSVTVVNSGDRLITLTVTAMLFIIGAGLYLIGRKGQKILD